MYWHAVDVCACCWGLYAERRGVRANAGSKARIQLPVHRGSNGEMNYMGGRFWQILADYACGCARRICGRGQTIEGGPARAAAGDHARARVSESQSFTSAQRALTHHTSDHISNTPTQDTQRKRNSETPHTPHGRDTRARPPRSRGRYRCRGTGAGRDTRERCKKAERLSRQGRTTAPDAAPSRSPHSQ